MKAIVKEFNELKKFMDCSSIELISLLATATIILSIIFRIFIN